MSTYSSETERLSAEVRELRTLIDTLSRDFAAHQRALAAAVSNTAAMRGELITARGDLNACRAEVRRLAALPTNRLETEHVIAVGTLRRADAAGAR